ncbi:MAG TPA: ATP-binding protein [Longimicrobiales bacterium]
MATRVLVIGSPAQPPDWRAAVAEPHELALVPDIDAVDEPLSAFDAALVDAAAVDALHVAQQLHARDATLQLTAVGPADVRGRIGRAMIVRRGIGELWLIDGAELDAAFIERAAEVTRQRRGSRATHRRIEHDFAAIERQTARAAFTSDAYLAALLAVLPDPVVSIDADGRVISWNRAAEKCFDRPRLRALGRPLADATRPADTQALEQLLSQAAPNRPARGELVFEATERPWIAEVVVAHVAAEGRESRLVLLHDVTEQRRVQAELEASAAELEAQSEELHNQSAMLEEAQAELEAANKELQRANAALTQRTLEAERARAEADRANLAKSEFLATMSHEIRTPINAIIGYNELLRMELAGPLEPKQRQHLERIRASSRHLLDLIQDVLDLAKIEARRVEVGRERALAVNAVALAVGIVAPQAQASSVTLTSAEPADSTEAYYFGDERRVQQIIVNLLTNAIKFTDAGGRVEIAYGVAQESPLGAAATWIRVTDTGIGIAAPDLHRIFRPFEQLQQGHTRRHGGAGLGLAISRELAHLMGGEISVRSAPGAGSAFTLWLPRTTPDERKEIGFDIAAEPYPPGVAEVGRALHRAIETITERFTRSLRDALPVARELPDPVVQDHVAAYLADVAQTLIDVASQTGAASLVRDGSEIQHVIANLHGRQRARFGWTAEALTREMELLYGIIEDMVRDECAHCDGGDVDAALRIVRRMLVTAEQVSLQHVKPAHEIDDAG